MATSSGADLSFKCKCWVYTWASNGRYTVWTTLKPLKYLKYVGNAQLDAFWM